MMFLRMFAMFMRAVSFKSVEEIGFSSYPQYFSSSSIGRCGSVPRRFWERLRECFMLKNLAVALGTKSSFADLNGE